MVFCDWLLSLSIMFSRIIQVVACTNTLFLFIIKSYFIVWIYHILFTYSSANGHLGCFHFWPWKNAYVSTYVQVFVWTYVFNSFGSVPWSVIWWSHMVTLCLTYRGTDKLFSIVGASFSIPTSNVWRFQFLYILTKMCYYYLSFWLQLS